MLSIHSPIYYKEDKMTEETQEETKEVEEETKEESE